MLGDPGIRTPQLVELLHDIAHQIHIVASPGPIVADGTGHPLVKRFVDHRDGQHPFFPLINIGVLQHHPVAVEAVHNYINIIFLTVITDNGHGIAVDLDALIEQPHLRRRHGIGIVGVGLYFFYGNLNNPVNGTFILHILSPLCFGICV